MAETCYRHPDRETRVSCSSCGRPICPDCMTPTPVGMRCPECMQQRTKVVRGVGGGASGFQQMPASFILIGLNVIAYLIEIGSGAGGFSSSGSTIVGDFALFGPAVAEGEWYRLVTSGFLHASLFHIGFNMLLLFFLGRLLEPALGTPRFVALYFASLLAGSMGALLLDPNALTLGASGAVFGLAGATFVIARGRGMDAIAGEIGFLIVFNLIFSFVVPRISVGGHLGGLAAGFLCALAIVAGERGYLGRRHFPAELAIIVLIAVGAFFGALAVA
ncbi:MAG: rhomboid family intramembrane serine protease [Solirubrobacterales bacterium]